MLDFGTGPGTAVWSARGIWDTIDRVTAIDNNQYMLDTLSTINANESLHIANLTLQKHQKVQHEFTPQEQFDLVTSAFVLGELPSDTNRAFTVEGLWKQTGDILVLVDRGTPLGFAHIEQARKHIIEFSKARGIECHIVAPCPHEMTCPMVGTSNWCHFSQQVRQTPQMVIKFNHRNHSRKLNVTISTLNSRTLCFGKGQGGNRVSSGDG